MSGKGVILLTDKERMDLFYVCQDTKLAIEREQSRLENAMQAYFMAINRHNETVEEYLNSIQTLLSESED